MVTLQNMDLFSDFCNICYKTNDGSLSDISEENKHHLIDSLIPFIEHVDIIKYNVIYLCQLCCEQLTGFDKFRKMCISNLVQLRQRYFNMKSKLELEVDATAVQITLEKFVQEEVLRKNFSAVTTCRTSISTDYHEIEKKSADLNKNDSGFNRHVMYLKSERNECEFDVDCTDVSVKNSITEYDESRVAFDNEHAMKNDMLRQCEDTKLEEYEREYYDDFVVSDINNGNESDTTKIEFVKEEFHLKNEISINDSEGLTLNNFGNESSVHVSHDVEALIAYNIEEDCSRTDSTTVELHVKEENDASENLELEKNAFEFVIVCTTIPMQDFEEDVKVEIKLPSTSCNSKSIAGSINSKAPHLAEHWNSRSATAWSAAAHELVDSRKAQRTCAVCKKAFTRSSYLITHERIHSGDRPYKCNVCNKAFAQSSNLVKHKQTHSGDRSYKCIVCYKTFTQASALSRHKHIHSR